MVEKEIREKEDGSLASRHKNSFLLPNTNQLPEFEHGDMQLQMTPGYKAKKKKICPLQEVHFSVMTFLLC